MGTRSLVIFKNAERKDEESEFGVLYRQSDGYPTGMGADILECFQGKVVVNGYSGDDEINGAGDMAVQLIAFLKQKGSWGLDPHFKTIPKPVNTPGGLYLMPVGTRDTWEEYLYTITCPRQPKDAPGRWEGKLLLTVEGHGKFLFEGILDDFDPEEAEKIEHPEEE